MSLKKLVYTALVKTCSAVHPLFQPEALIQDNFSVCYSGLGLSRLDTFVISECTSFSIIFVNSDYVKITRRFIDALKGNNA